MDNRNKRRRAANRPGLRLEWSRPDKPVSLTPGTFAYVDFATGCKFVIPMVDSGFLGKTRLKPLVARIRQLRIGEYYNV